MAEFIKTKRGARSLHCNGYQYTMNRRGRDGQTYWRCIDHSCLGRATTNQSDVVIAENQCHDHPPETTQVTVANRCLSMLKEEAQNGGLQLHPEKIVTDFELGVIQAVELQFPMAKVQGCFYHYAQCIWRKVQNLGLQPAYKEYASFNVFVKKMNALSFCPKRYEWPNRLLLRMAWMGLKAITHPTSAGLMSWRHISRERG